jgi:hypothetical protein
MESEIIYTAIGIGLFLFRNPNRDFQIWIVVAVACLLVSDGLAVYRLVDDKVAMVLWILSSGGLIVFYGLRFGRKKSYVFFDYLKLVGVALLITYPLPFYIFAELAELNHWFPLREMTVPVIGFLYLYDRWILKPEPMKKKFVVILVGQSLFILLMIMYAFVQKAEADTQRGAAMQQMEQNQELLQLKTNCK